MLTWPGGFDDHLGSGADKQITYKNINVRRPAYLLMSFYAAEATQVEKKKWFGKCHAIHFHINLSFLNESRIANNWFVSIIAVTYAVYICRRWFCICLIVCVLVTSSKYKRNLTKLSGNGRLFVNNCWNVRGVWKFFISQWECITMNVSHNYDWCSNEASKIRPVVSEKHKMTSGPFY